MMGAPNWPRKTRELHNHHMDSTRWNDFAFRDGDVIIATYAKAGTTWVQQIVGQLIFNGAGDVKINEISPWVELRIMPPDTNAMLAKQTHRRFLKTHLPLDALNFSPRAKYIYVARDGRDVAWSLHHHHMCANQLYYDLANETPGLVGPPLARPDPDVRRYFQDWLKQDGAPIWSFWESVSTWWAARALPNVLLIHFNDLKADLEGSIRRIANFLDISIAEADWANIVQHCSFAYSKRHGADLAPMGGAVFEGGAESFFNKGTNGNWRDTLTAADVESYERTAVARLRPECAAWLAGSPVNPKKLSG